VPTPWITPDEPIYGLLAQALWRDGDLAILGGPTPYYTAVMPALAGVALGLDDLVLGHSLLKVLQAFVMSLAAVPVYLWGRSMLPRRPALLAAALTLALPGLAYSGLVMTEVVFYPAFVLAAWAMALAIDAPTRSHQLFVVGAVCLALATRIQAVVLLPIFVTALALAAGFGRTRLRPSRHAVALGGLGLLMGGWLAWRVGGGGSVLAGYSGAGGSYAYADAARFVAYHAGDVALLTGIFPLCALLVLLAIAARLGERDPRVSAYLAVAAATVGWMVLEVGVFASRELGLLAERNLIAVAPVVFLGFALWLDRGVPGGYWGRLLAALVVAVSVLALPLGDFVVPDALPHAFSVIPLESLRTTTSLDTLELILAVAVAAAVAIFALTPRRAIVAVPLLVLLALVGGSIATSREVGSQARAQQLRVLGPERRWVDSRADGPVAYVYDGQAYWNAVWENLFWNRRIRWVYDLPGQHVPGPLPQREVEVRPDGEVRPGGERSPARFAVVPLHFALRGEQVATAPQVGTDRRGLGLWRLDLPLRLSTITSGLYENGDVDRIATLLAYDCRGGWFEATLLVKEPQTVRVLRDGELVEHRIFDRPATWRVTIFARKPSTGEAQICKLTVAPTGLLGTTLFVFERAGPSA
jgi:hypothetical protein